MSTKFDMVKSYYDNGLWDIDRVWNVVNKAITPDEYLIITGFVYPNKTKLADV